MFISLLANVYFATRIRVVDDALEALKTGRTRTRGRTNTAGISGSHAKPDLRLNAGNPVEYAASILGAFCLTSAAVDVNFGRNGALGHAQENEQRQHDPSSHF